MTKFNIFIGQDNLYHWRFIAANGEIVCWSEGYSSRQAALNSVEWVKKNSPSSPIN